MSTHAESLVRPHPEYLVVHNVALGAACMTTFAQSYFSSRDQVCGPSLPVALLVLPVCFHERTVSRISRLQSSSGLLHALHEMPELPVGLQERLEDMFDVSMRSLALATAGGLLRRDPGEGWPEFVPLTKSLPVGFDIQSDGVKAIIATAKRLGWWFAGENLVSICNRLNVRF